MGDEVRDVFGAHRAGMPIIAVDWGFALARRCLIAVQLYWCTPQRSCKSVARLGASVMDLELIHIEKLVPGGQGLGTLASGQKVFVWNVLPGEEVECVLLRKSVHTQRLLRKTCADPSPARIEPREPEVYLGSSPWQMMDFEAENAYKAELAHESMHQESAVAGTRTANRGNSGTRVALP